MRRLLAALFLALALAPGLWWRSDPARPAGPPLASHPLDLPPEAALKPHLGELRLEQAWELRSASGLFGGYSALVPLDGGRRFLAVSDRGNALPFTVPGPLTGPVPRLRLAEAGGLVRDDYDAEAATRDPATGRIWIAWETSNAISRFGPDLRRQGTVEPPDMRGWGVNDGPESLLRLADGRFLTLREGTRSGLLADLLGLPWRDTGHDGLLFPGDPLAGTRPVPVIFAGPDPFSPVDMAQLPDGRVLILMRRMVWPLPLRFAGRIVVADPRDLRPGAIWRGRVVASLTSTIGVDNFEAIAVTPAADGRINLWLMSDDNGAAQQRTLLWRLSADPARL